MKRKIIIVKQMVIPFAVLSILIVRDYAIKELSKKNLWYTISA